MSDACQIQGCGHPKKGHWRQGADIRGCATDGCDCSCYVSTEEVSDALTSMRKVKP